MKTDNIPDNPPGGAGGATVTTEGPAVAKSKVNRTLVLDILSAAARFYMAYIWLKAGTSKLSDHMAVAQSIKAYEIFTPEWSNYLAYIIGPLETAGGLLLLFGLFLRRSGWVSIGVLALFVIGIFSVWARGLGIDCGCFAAPTAESAQAANYLKLILRDGMYILITLFMIWRPFKKFALYP